jgi:hypothetical protein
MRVVFDHINGFGKVSDQDFIYSQPHGVLEEGEKPSDALAQGWIPWDGDWYNLRSVRLDLSRYKPHETTKRLAKKIQVDYKEFVDTPEYRNIYQQYLDYHGYERTITWEQLFTGNVLCYYHKEELVGYSLVDVYDNVIVATQFVWNYEEPKLSLGRVAQYCECLLAETLGCKYVYILGGYEECCLYKGEFYGFEFWTGKEWSEDKTLYKQLCLRDEKALVKYEDI